MTTRRAVLRWAAAGGAGAIAGLAAGCERHDRAAPTGGPPASGDVLLVDTDSGPAALTAGGRAVVPAAPGLLGADTGLVHAAARGGRTEVTVWDARRGAPRWRASLTGALSVRAGSADGRLVALVAGAGEGSAYRPTGRLRTTVVVADDGGERTRLDLPGNVEPEAFSADGQRMFVLDYLPPDAPDRYRVRMVHLASGRLEPLLTRVKSAVPQGAEEEMRGQGRQAVYDPRRRMLFTLYIHQPEHLHTRDLLAGARPGAAHVHAFVHALSLAEHWAYCVDLPAPFGEGAPEAHAIALDAGGNWLAVAACEAGALALVDPDALAVSVRTAFDPAGPGDAAVRFAPDGSLLVAADRHVVRLAAAGKGEAGRWSCPSPVRGVVPHPAGERVYVGHDGGVTCHDLATGRVLARTAVPRLRRLRDVLAPG